MMHPSPIRELFSTRRTHPNYDLVFNRAAVDRGVVPNGHPVAHGHRIQIALPVEHGTVLDV